MPAFTYDAANSTGDRDGDAGQERVAREAQGGHDERRGHEEGEDAQLDPAKRARSTAHAGTSAIALEVANELAGKHDAEAATLLVPVDQRRGEGPGP